MTRMRPAITWGAVTAALYIAAAVGGSPWPGVRILYDGLAPLPPYQWVRPPAQLAGSNHPAEGGGGAIALTPSGSVSASFATADDQAAVVFPPDAIAKRTGEAQARVTLTPLDPVSLAPAPAGLHLDGNAYRIEASYARSGAPVTPRKRVTVVLRFPATGTQMLKFNGGRWDMLPATTIPPAMQDIADVDQLGIFVAAGPLTARPSVSALLYRAFTVLLWVAVAVLLLSLMRDYWKDRGRRSAPRGRS
jgi:hypothetical protein